MGNDNKRIILKRVYAPCEKCNKPNAEYVYTAKIELPYGEIGLLYKCKGCTKIKYLEEKVE